MCLLCTLGCVITLSFLAAIGWSRKFPTSASPGCPAQSKPSSDIISTPRDSAFFACRMVVHCESGNMANKEKVTNAMSLLRLLATLRFGLKPCG